MRPIDADEQPIVQPDVPDTNVGDMISRQAAIDAADRADYTGLAIEDVKKVTDEVVKELKQLPSAQPEIIRCKDCKFWRTYTYVNGKSKFLPRCGFNQIYVNGEDFCSRAEKRKNDKR